MTEVISVHFRNGCKTYYFDPQGIEVPTGEQVIVETAAGNEFATCVEGNHMVPDQQVVKPLRPLIRLATENDRRTDAYNRSREKEAFAICEKKIAAHKLEMKLIRVESNFDGSKIIFFFTAEGRVDFRELVKDLAGVFRSRIELRQVGVRDEAKMVGGLGICGRPLCCSQFLENFMPVSIKMAKTQNLSLNPTKISGTCGRLMCCLKYEQGAYEDAVKRCPKQESFVECPDGVGNVSSVDLLKERVKVRLEDSAEQPKSYRVSEIRVVRSGKGKRPEDYVAPPREELEKLRYIPPEEERKAQRFGEEKDLAALLEQYLNQQQDQEPQKAEGKSKSGGRNSHRRRGGKKETQNAGGGQPAQPREKQPAQAKEKQQPTGQGRQQGQAKAAQQPAKAKLAQPAQNGSGAETAPSGEKKRRPRHRPHHRRPKNPGGGEQSQ